MAAITTREVAATNATVNPGPLSNAQVDNNFININNELSSHSHSFNGLTSKTGGTGTYTTSGDYRAPIFYDSDNPAYYADLNNTGTCFNGAGSILTAGNVTAYYSDERLKTRIGEIENALEKVCKLSGFYYEANETAQRLGYEVIREVGVSAQEVQAVLPEIIKPAPIDNRYLTVQYERLVPLLIEAIKELHEEVKRIKQSLG